MKRYVVRRLLMAVPLLIAISFVCFMFINLIPSNPAEVALRVQQMPVITEEAIAEMEEMLGQIEQTQRHLEQDFQDISPEMRRQLQEEMEALETALRQAERVVLSAFGQESM